MIYMTWKIFLIVLDYIGCLGAKQIVKWYSLVKIKKVLCDMRHKHHRRTRNRNILRIRMKHLAR